MEITNIVYYRLTFFHKKNNDGDYKYTFYYIDVIAIKYCYVIY